MLSFVRTRHSAYFNFAFLFVVLGGWLFFYLQPVLRSMVGEEYLFYGKVSYAAIPSIFGNTDIPLLDKTYFQLNSDKNATFVLYASKEMLSDMSDWFHFGARNVGDIPLEVTAARVRDNLFVVSSMANSEGFVEWDDLMEYQFHWALVYLCVEGVCLLGFITFLILGFRVCSKRRKLECSLAADSGSDE